MHDLAVADQKFASRSKTGIITEVTAIDQDLRSRAKGGVCGFFPCSGEITVRVLTPDLFRIPDNDMRQIIEAGFGLMQGTGVEQSFRKVPVVCVLKLIGAGNHCRARAWIRVRRVNRQGRRWRLGRHLGGSGLRKDILKSLSLL